MHVFPLINYNGKGSIPRV